MSGICILFPKYRFSIWSLQKDKDEPNVFTHLLQCHQVGEDNLVLLEPKFVLWKLGSACHNWPF